MKFYVDKKDFEQIKQVSLGSDGKDSEIIFARALPWKGLEHEYVELTVKHKPLKKLGFLRRLKFAFRAFKRSLRETKIG